MPSGRRDIDYTNSALVIVGSLLFTSMALSALLEAYIFRYWRSLHC